MTVISEYLKLRSTRSPLWVALTVLVLSFALATAIPDRPAAGPAMFGVPVLMVLSALTVTGEYRTGMIRTTFLATPNRVRLLAAKALVAALFSGVVAAVATLGSLVLAAAAPDGRTVGAVTLYAVLGAVLAVGLGALVRHSAAAIAVLLLLPFVVEPLLGASRQLGPRIGPLLPFTNAEAFTGVTWLQMFSMWWGPVGSALYFAAVSFAVFGVAAVVVSRRDA